MKRNLMKIQRIPALLGIALLFNCPAKTLAAPFALPLRFDSAGTCIGIGSTTHTIETAYGSSLSALPFTGATTYDFYSPPITAAPSLTTADKGGGLLWLTNGSTTTDFHVTVRFIFYDFDPATLTDTLIVDTASSSSTAIKHLQAEKVVPPNASLPADFTAIVGHLLHVRAAVTLVSGAVGSASILFNAASGAKGDSVGFLPQNTSAKSWTFGSLAGPPDATITPSSSCISANCGLNTASVPPAAGA